MSPDQEMASQVIGVAEAMHSTNVLCPSFIWGWGGGCWCHQGELQVGLKPVAQEVCLQVRSAMSYP